MTGCKTPGCLTHPALCEGRKCTTRITRYLFIPYIHTYIHAKRGRYGERASSVHQGGTQETGEKEGCRRLDLGRVCTQGGRNRRNRVTSNCLPSTCDTRQAAVRCDMLTILEAINSLSEAAL